MRYLTLLLVFLSGCAASTADLLTEAKDCVSHYSENGVITSAPDEYRAQCWTRVNSRYEAEERRAKRAREQVKCPKGRILIIERGNPVGCASQDQVRRMMGTRY